MIDKELPLLSIIIPTKNRQFTCLYAIESVLLIESDIIELVIQDCSETEILKEQIFNKFGNDKRIKYFYTDTLPSMTENWNLAISNSTGQYICGIGDDDAVLPSCLEFTKWMYANQIQAVLGANVHYVWKDAATSSYTNGRLSHNMHYTGDIFEVEVKDEFYKKAMNCGFGYTDDLANLYHGIIEKSLLEIHKKNSGHYLSGTSLDVYNAMTMPTYLKKSFYVDYPLTLKGASRSSNSNRIYSKKGFNIHLSEYKNLQIPEVLPTVLNADVSIAESTIVALQHTKQEDLISKMNLNVVYAKCAAIDLLNFFNYYNQYKQRKNINNTNGNFFSNFYKFLKERVKASVKNLILKTTFSIPGGDKYIEKYTNKRRVTAPDILVANSMLQEHLTNNSMTIKYNAEIKKLISKKMPWE